MEVGQRELRRKSMLAQINVTPFVDVMLVLLIIFMVTAPMLEKGVDIRLPKVANAPNLAATQEPLVVTVNREGMIKVQGKLVDSTAKLGPLLRQVLAGRQDQTVNIQADQAVPYGKVVQVIAEINHAGINKLVMIAEELDQRPGQ
jgi:biopolymer transport protein TolR